MRALFLIVIVSLSIDATTYTVAITVSPVTQTDSINEVVQFFVTAENATSYQWQIKRPLDSDFTDTSGATDSTLSITSRVDNDSLLVRCIASDGVNFDTSTSAYFLTINPVPSGSHALATIHKPSAVLDSFVLSIDLSRMPAEFNANTDSSGYCRVYKYPSMQELPSDLVWGKFTSDSGCLKVFYDRIDTVDGQKIAVYPPNTANRRYSRTDTYGRDKVYEKYIAYFPLDGNGNERSGNGYDLTVSGAFDTLGHNCRALRFDGIDDYAAETTNKIPAVNFQSAFSVSFWMYPVSGGESAGAVIDKSSGGNGANGFALGTRTTVPGSMYAFVNTAPAISSNEASFGSYHFITMSFANNGDVNTYINGAQSGSPDDATNALTSITTTSSITVGNRSGATDRSFDGIIDDIQIIEGVKSEDWNTEEYLMESDQATFWGTWTWVTTNNYPKRSNWSTFNDRWRGWRW